jgi:HD-GYP domain-containing protein (c-di-GMP phosphodiesterase class II)
MNEKFSQFLFCMVTAIAQCSLYSKDHPAVSEYCGNALDLLSGLFINDSIDITHLGGKLILNDTPLLEKGTYMENFVKRMKTKGIDKIIFKRGISTEELLSFIYCMASKTEPPVSTDHIIVGTVQVRVKQSEDDPLAIMRESISKIKDVYQEFSRSKRLDIISLEDAVLGFLLALKKEANVLRLVSPIKSHSEYTYVHAANVAVLTLFQAQSLGLKDEGLRETGYAGLLHDIGKLLVSKEIIEKQAKLNEAEWKEMKRHPIYGAIYLGSLPDLPRLAVIAAYEHHLKFDGSGYPDTKWRARKQHILSQIVALSDFFDALRAERPYRKGVELHALIDLIKGGSGKDFNPQLVDSFIIAMKKAGALSFS